MSTAITHHTVRSWVLHNKTGDRCRDDVGPRRVVSLSCMFLLVLAVTLLTLASTDSSCSFLYSCIPTVVVKEEPSFRQLQARLHVFIVLYDQQPFTPGLICSFISSRWQTSNSSELKKKKKKKVSSVLWDFSAFWAKQSWRDNKKPLVLKTKAEGGNEYIQKISYLLLLCWINYLRDGGLISAFAFSFLEDDWCCVFYQQLHIVVVSLSAAALRVSAPRVY